MGLTREGKIELPSDPFWDFSVAIYDRPGVAAACLRLQDRHGADVNLLLFTVFAGCRGMVLDSASVRSARDAVGRWQAEVVVPLRALRRSLKRDHRGAPSAHVNLLRQQLAASELAAEHVEQLMLSALLEGDGSGASEHATQNVEIYLDLLGVRPDAADREALALIVEAGLGA